MPIVSIQVAATHKDEVSVEVVSQASATVNHYSVYTRNADGTVDIVEDYACFGPGICSGARDNAILHAAKLSMEHHVPIEPIK